MDDRLAEVRTYIEGRDRELYREAPLQIAEIRDSSNGIPGSYTIKGSAAVYNKWSLDLGGFRERILPGAFDRVLSENPHVIHTWDHDTARALSSTRSKQFPLELKSAKDALDFYSRVAPTTDAANLRILMDGGVVDQSSFAFTVRDAEWRFLEDEDMVERDIIEVDQLFDVTTCALGAYPQTESQIAVRSLMRGALTANEARERIWVPGMTTTSTAANGATTTVTTSFGTRSSGAEGNAEQPVPDPAPEEETGDTADAAPQEDVTPPADQPAPPEQPEDREAKERKFRLWQQKRAAEHRRTREFVYGVTSKEES